MLSSFFYFRVFPFQLERCDCFIFLIKFLKPLWRGLCLSGLGLRVFIVSHSEYGGWWLGKAGA